MKRTTAGILVIIMLCALSFSACKRQETAVSGEVTETIAPATPQPAPTGTDAMTQTVDIEAGRTDAEGGTLTGTDTDMVPAGNSTGVDTAGSPTPSSATSTR